MLYWRYRCVDFAVAMAPPIGLDKWRCLERLGMMLRVQFHREMSPLPAPRSGRPFVPPMRWRDAQQRVLLLEGRDPRGEVRGFAVDALGGIYDTIRGHPTAVEHKWEEVMR